MEAGSLFAHKPGRSSKERRTFYFLSHEVEFPGNLLFLGNKPQSLPFDILSLSKTKPFLQYSNISQEEILILPAPRMGPFANFTSDGSQIHIPLSLKCAHKGRAREAELNVTATFNFFRALFLKEKNARDEFWSLRHFM